jgi:hypothetical protein
MNMQYAKYQPQILNLDTDKRNREGKGTAQVLSS